MILKKTALFYGIVHILTISAFSQPVESRVYSVENAMEIKTSYGTKKEIFTGTSTHLKKVEFVLIQLDPESVFPKLDSKHYENLLIVKNGLLSVSLNGKISTLTSGSIALVLPESEFLVSNETGEAAEFYLMTYQGKTQHVERLDSVQSFVKLWEDIEYKPHDKGGIRNFYHLSTVMNDYFEMHVTNLNGMIKSHEPHTHRAAEIVLMIHGNTEMEIGDGIYEGKEGDVYFLGSNVPHAIKNKGNEQCQYFAFQWQ